MPAIFIFDVKFNLDTIAYHTVGLTIYMYILCGLQEQQAENLRLWVRKTDQQARCWALRLRGNQMVSRPRASTQ